MTTTKFRDHEKQRELALDETEWLPAKRGCGSGAK